MQDFFKTPPPGKHEPLFTTLEIADKLGITRGKVTSLLQHHKELAPQSVFKTSVGAGRCKVNMYRMSDVRVWLAHHRIDLSLYSKGRA